MSTVPSPSGYAANVLVAVTLLASITVAIVIVPLTDTTPQARLGFLPGTPDQVAIVVGTVATVSLLGAVLLLLPMAAAGIATWYGLASLGWSNGIGMFVLTLGLIAHGKVPAVLPVLAIGTVVAVIAWICAREQRRKKWWQLLLQTLPTTAGCLVVAVAALS